MARHLEHGPVSAKAPGRPALFTIEAGSWSQPSTVVVLVIVSPVLLNWVERVLIPWKAH